MHAVRSLRFFLSLLTMVMSVASAAPETKHPDCPAPRPLSANNLNPQQIAGWLRTVGTKVKTVQQFVCCLPESYRKNYVVGHSSQAAQSGTPENPRVILSTPETQLPPFSTVPSLTLSFNGGRGAEQGDSVEMAFRDPRTKKLTFFDLEISPKKRGHLSKGNPESCMNCHGESGRVPTGGPKYIFEPFAGWTRFVGGMINCSPEEDQIQNMAADRAIAALRENPRFQCLDRKQLEVDTSAKSPAGRYPKLGGNLARFDNRITSHDRQQSRSWLRSRPRFDDYKFLLIGEKVCGPFLEIGRWAPTDLVQRNMKRASIDDRLKKSGPFDEVTRSAFLDEFEKIVHQREKWKTVAKNPKDLYRHGMELNHHAVACTSKEALQAMPMFPGFDEKLVRSRDPSILFQADSSLRGNRIGVGVPSAAARFFLEGEEHGTHMIQSSAVPWKNARGHAEILLSEEPKESELRSLFTPIKGLCPQGAVCYEVGSETWQARSPEICEELRERSLRALSRDSEPAAAPTGRQ